MKTIFLITAAAASILIAIPGISQTTIVYTSPLADYQPFVDKKVTAWKAANDKVGQIGGWRAYAKEAQQPDNTSANAPVAAPISAPTPTPSPTSAPNTGNTLKSQKTDPHAGHHQ